MNPRRSVLFATTLVALAACADAPDATKQSSNVVQDTTRIGSDPISVFDLNNGKGMTVRIMEYGATILSIQVPDRTGAIDDVTLGLDKVDDYLTQTRFLGAIVGRYGNRIAHGSFTIDGKKYELAKNNGPNHLHGGLHGFDKVIWKGEPFQHGDTSGVVFRYTSAAGEEGYPGKLDVSVTYSLTPKNELIVDYHATTDAPTHVNLTQHSYFNLAGAGKTSVLDHQMQLFASRYTPVDSTKIPLGELAPVENTPFDFRTPTAIGARIAADHPQIKIGNGYDHNFVLDRQGDGLVQAAHVVEPTTGRTMDVFTTEPGIQLFTGNSFDGSMIGKGNLPYQRNAGFCLETQRFPDSPNQPNFPSTLLQPGSEYKTRTVFAFGVTG